MSKLKHFTKDCKAITPGDKVYPRGTSFEVGEHAKKHEPCPKCWPYKA